jgi:MFS family permease
MHTLRTFGYSTFSVLRVHNYRLYFIGQGISLIGTWMQTVGQALLVIKMTQSGTQLGYVVGAQFLPILIFGPWGGLLADRFSKRKILLATQSTAGFLALILGILVATHLVQLWMVYVLAVSLGFVNTVDNPTRQSFIYEMVGKKYLTKAVSLNSTEVNMARVIGPAIGGILVATVGLSLCFFLNSISFVAVIFVLLMMNVNELQKPPAIAQMKGQLLEGFRYVKSNRLLRNTLLMMAIIGTLSYEFQVILPLFAQFTFHNINYYAWLTTAMGLGSIAGGFVTANKKIIRPSTLITASFLFGISLLILSVMPNIFFAFIALLFVGGMSIAILTFGNITLQMESIPQMRGRVLSLWTITFLGSTPIGGPIIGWIGTYAGPRWGLAVGGMAAIIAGGIGILTLTDTLIRHKPALYSTGQQTNMP